MVTFFRVLHRPMISFCRRVNQCSCYLPYVSLYVCKLYMPDFVFCIMRVAFEYHVVKYYVIRYTISDYFSGSGEAIGSLCVRLSATV